MSGTDAGERQEGVQLYCLGALVAEEAARSGFRDFACALEAALSGFLSGLPREAQGQALRLSYEIALSGDEPAPPRLRLVHSSS